MNIVSILFSLISGKITPSFIKGILPLVSKSAQTLIAKLLPEAVKVVTELASQGKLTDKQKQKEAFTKLQKTAQKEGLEVGASLINLIIELAVTSLKK